jgi:hypothetical protein
MSTGHAAEDEVTELLPPSSISWLDIEDELELPTSDLVSDDDDPDDLGGGEL